MKHLRYVIEYEYPGTVNGVPVGRVFAQRLEPPFAPGTWSYVHEAQAATLFTTEDEARREASTKSWPSVKVVAVGIEGGTP